MKLSSRWMRPYTLFNLGRNMRLGVVPVVDDEDYSKHVGWWLSGRVFGVFISHMMFGKGGSR